MLDGQSVSLDQGASSIVVGGSTIPFITAPTATATNDSATNGSGPAESFTGDGSTITAYRQVGTLAAFWVAGLCFSILA